jgi:DNA-binding IscR family transcriptional regulator
MIRDEKWLNYAVMIIKVIHTKGTGTITSISEEIGGSGSYIAKVVASLRKSGLIDKNYELPKRPEEITITELLNLKPIDENDIKSKVSNIISKALEVPITEIW